MPPFVGDRLLPAGKALNRNSVPGAKGNVGCLNSAKGGSGLNIAQAFDAVKADGKLQLAILVIRLSILSNSVIIAFFRLKFAKTDNVFVGIDTRYEVVVPEPRTLALLAGRSLPG